MYTRVEIYGATGVNYTTKFDASGPIGLKHAP